MNTLLLHALLDGSVKGKDSFGNGAIVALLCIVMVFLILALIIFITWVVNIVIQKCVKTPAKKEEATAAIPAAQTAVKPDLNDEDAMIATLVASVDLRNETHKNVKVISVKEIK